MHLKNVLPVSLFRWWAALAVLGLATPAVGQRQNEEVLFFDGRTDQTDNDIGGAVFYPLDTGRWRFWYRGLFNTRLSPNGRKIVYRWGDNGVDYPIHIADANGQNPRSVLRGEADRGGPASWSPTGDRLAFFVYGVLRIIDLQGKELGSYEIENLRTIRPPSWSPDGTRILYDTLRDLPETLDAIVSIDLATGTRTVLASGTHALLEPGVSLDSHNTMVSDPVWSPRGDEIAVRFREVSIALDSEPGHITSRENIGVIPATGGPVRLLTSWPSFSVHLGIGGSGSPNALAWSPDGHSIAYSFRSNAPRPNGGVEVPMGIYQVPASGGESVLVNGFLPGVGNTGQTNGPIQWTILNPTGLEARILLDDTIAQRNQPFEARVKVTSFEASPVTITFPDGLLATVDDNLLKLSGAATGSVVLTPDEPVKIFTVQILPGMEGRAELATAIEASIKGEVVAADDSVSIEIVPGQ